VNPKTQEGVCVHQHFKHAYITNPSEQITRELGRTGRLISWLSLLDDIILKLTNATEGLESNLRLGHSLCSLTADKIMSGTGEDHVKPVDNLKIFRPFVRLSVRHASQNLCLPLIRIIVTFLCYECFCRHEPTSSCVQFRVTIETRNALERCFS
jgi:hypothetical protein